MTLSARLAGFIAVAKPYAVALATVLAPAAPYFTAGIRAVLIGAGGGLVAKGYFTSSQEQQAIGYAIAGAGALWSQWQKAHAQKTLDAAIAAPAGMAKPPAG